MTRLLLAHSFYLRHDRKQRARMKPYPPLATLLAAALLRERGYEVHLFDAMLAAGRDDYRQALERADPHAVAIVEDNFNFITKMCTARNHEDALAMVGQAKARGCAVVVNGSDASDRPAEYLAAGADVVIAGETEPALCDVIDTWARAGRRAALDGIAGLVLPCEPGARRGSNGAGAALRRTAPRPNLNDLDALPLPAWDLVDVEAYRSAWTAAHGRFSWNVVTSRGCPYGCNWCAKPIWGRRYAQRSPQHVAHELARLRDEVAPDHVWFADDIFGLTPAWIESFAAAVAARDARVPFMMQSRVNLMNARTVAALAESGAEEVWMGVESGSQAVLDAMDKGTALGHVRTATRALKSQGIRSCWFVMLGYPGEEWGEILRTRDLIREEAPDDIGVSVAYPLPGTVFHDRVRAQLGRKRSWSETDELAMLFQGAYDTTFYREVRDVLHAEVARDADRTVLDAHWSDLERRAGDARRRPTPDAAAAGA